MIVLNKEMYLKLLLHALDVEKTSTLKNNINKILFDNKMSRSLLSSQMTQ
jgi:hypothetical protein